MNKLTDVLEKVCKAIDKIENIDFDQTGEEIKEDLLGIHRQFRKQDGVMDKVEDCLQELQTVVDEYKSIEDELGINLVVLMNVIKNGFYVKGRSGYIDFRASYDNYGDEVKYAFIVDYKHKELRWMHSYMCGRVHPFVYGCPTYEFKKYGKSWALTKEELEVKQNESERT